MDIIDYLKTKIQTIIASDIRHDNGTGLFQQNELFIECLKIIFKNGIPDTFPDGSTTEELLQFFRVPLKEEPSETANIRYGKTYNVADIITDPQSYIYFIDAGDCTYLESEYKNIDSEWIPEYGLAAGQIKDPATISKFDNNHNLMDYIIDKNITNTIESDSLSGYPYKCNLHYCYSTEQDKHKLIFMVDYGVNDQSNYFQRFYYIDINNTTSRKEACKPIKIYRYIPIQKPDGTYDFQITSILLLSNKENLEWFTKFDLKNYPDISPDIRKQLIEEGIERILLKHWGDRDIIRSLEAYFLKTNDGEEDKKPYDKKGCLDGVAIGFGGFPDEDDDLGGGGGQDYQEGGNGKLSKVIRSNCMVLTGDRFIPLLLGDSRVNCTYANKNGEEYSIFSTIYTKLNEQQKIQIYLDKIDNITFNTKVPTLEGLIKIIVEKKSNDYVCKIKLNDDEIMEFKICYTHPSLGLRTTTRSRSLTTSSALPQHKAKDFTPSLALDGIGTPLGEIKSFSSEEYRKINDNVSKCIDTLKEKARTAAAAATAAASAAVAAEAFEAAMRPYTEKIKNIYNLIKTLISFFINDENIIKNIIKKQAIEVLTRVRVPEFTVLSYNATFVPNYKNYIDYLDLIIKLTESTKTDLEEIINNNNNLEPDEIRKIQEYVKISKDISSKIAQPANISESTGQTADQISGETLVDTAINTINDIISYTSDGEATDWYTAASAQAAKEKDAAIKAADKAVMEAKAKAAEEAAAKGVLPPGPSGVTEEVATAVSVAAKTATAAMPMVKTAGEAVAAAHTAVGTSAAQLPNVVTSAALAAVTHMAMEKLAKVADLPVDTDEAAEDAAKIGEAAHAELKKEQVVNAYTNIVYTSDVSPAAPEAIPTDEWKPWLSDELIAEMAESPEKGAGIMKGGGEEYVWDYKYHDHVEILHELYDIIAFKSYYLFYQKIKEYININPLTHMSPIMSACYYYNIISKNYSFVGNNLKYFGQKYNILASPDFLNSSYWNPVIDMAIKRKLALAGLAQAEAAAAREGVGTGTGKRQTVLRRTPAAAAAGGKQTRKKKLKIKNKSKNNIKKERKKTRKKSRKNIKKPKNTFKNIKKERKKTRKNIKKRKNQKKHLKTLKKSEKKRRPTKKRKAGKSS